MQNMAEMLESKTQLNMDIKIVNRLVGIGEIKVATGPLDGLQVVALGSCVAVIFFSPKIKAVAVAHVALPDSTVGRFYKKEDGYFADTAVKELISIFRELGVTQKRDLIIKLVGGASIMDPNGTFDIGKRNILALRKNLWLNGLGAIAEDVGNNISRSLKIKTIDGKVQISSPYKGTWSI